jgi:molecular chaperone HscB
MTDLQENYFALFDLSPRFQLNTADLEKTYLGLQGQYHPDRAASMDDATKRQYMMAATHINTAYQTLKKPVDRARYLLTLAGIDTEEETNTAMPMDFLMDQMQWREEIDAAKAKRHLEALENLHAALMKDRQSLTDTLASALDEQHDYPLAAMTVRKYRFYDRLDEEIGNAIESILF